MSVKNSKNGDSKYRLEPEQVKSLVELLIQCDERIEQLWDQMLKLRLALNDLGVVKSSDAPQMKVAVQKRAEVSELEKIQRQRLRKSLGLD